MRPHVRRLTTEEQRERFHLARRVGGMRAACGRVLGPDEPVYVESFVTGAARTASAARRYTVRMVAPVDAECASEAFLDEARGQEPERCAWCGRPVYYRRSHPLRQWASCSHRCAKRFGSARRRKVQG